ncbi:Carbonic anhydrase 2 [Phytophthora cinnamomi]|uniref:Carbonic anhydrase 2 n=1 Tax=Phytophthora cinnamomi TaxID=4785 RepID=UPI00355970C0|nr:Carbonic anhydrase 2 [Phytophthora cinnamomi]
MWWRTQQGGERHGGATAKPESHVNNNCTLTLETMWCVRHELPTSASNRHLCGVTYTVSQTPMTYNNLVNKTIRQVFANTQKKHRQDGDFSV